MNNHWPLVAAALMISIAVALGLWRRDSTIEALSARDANNAVPAPRHEAPAKLPAEAPAPEETTPKAPAVSTATATSATAAPAATGTGTGTGTATGASKFALPSAAPVAAPVAPAPPKALPLAAPAGKRNQILADLRTMLEAKLTIKATDVANGGYMLKVAGAQVEVQPAPNWSINVYNMNTQQPDAETDNFKLIYNDTATALGIDVNQKPTTLGTGKTSLQSGSKLGSVTVVRDPANGNSVVITPNQQKKAPPPADGQAAPQGRQVQPQTNAQAPDQPGAQTIVPPQTLQAPQTKPAQPETSKPPTPPKP